MSDLFHLCYVSRSIIDPDPEVLIPEIKQIISIAGVNNPANGVTGALLYNAGFFCQVIEGEADYLEQLFQRIEKDRRHVSCKLLNFAPIEERQFAQWSMLLAGIEMNPRPEIEHLFFTDSDLKLSDREQCVIDKMLEDIARLKLLSAGLDETTPEAS